MHSPDKTQLDNEIAYQIEELKGCNRLLKASIDVYNLQIREIDDKYEKLMRDVNSVESKLYVGKQYIRSLDAVCALGTLHKTPTHTKKDGVFSRIRKCFYKFTNFLKG